MNRLQWAGQGRTGSRTATKTSLLVSHSYIINSALNKSCDYNPTDDRNRLLLEPINHSECQYNYINASYVDVSCYGEIELTLAWCNMVE